MTKRVAFYLRVSTGDGQQTIENQRQALDEIAKRAGWQVIEILPMRLVAPRAASDGRHSTAC